MASFGLTERSGTGKLQHLADMKHLTFNGNFLKMHDSIDEMPITTFQTYNRFLLIDAGIGSDMESIGRHISRITRYIQSGDDENAIKELVNYQQNLLYVIEFTSPEMMAFGALIHSVNGRVLNGLTDEEIKDVLKELSRRGLTVGKVRGFLDHIKKKWMPSFRRSFQAPEVLKTMPISQN